MNIVDLAGTFGLRLKRQTTKEYYGACPKCGGKDRFRVWPKSDQQGGNFWCRKCLYKGDGLQLARDQLKCSYKEACELFGLSANDYSQPRQWAPAELPEKEPWVPSPVMDPEVGFLLRLSDIVRNCCSLAQKEPVGSLRRRGIRPYIFSTFSLGYNPVDRFFPLYELGISQDDYDSHEEWLHGRVCMPQGDVIPIHVNGRLISVKIRRENYGKSGDRGPKYQVLKGSGNACGVWHPLPEGRPLVIVESELDAVLLYQEAFDLVTPVSLGSASNRPDERVDALIRQAPSVLVALDNDDAGLKQRRWWQENYPETFHVVVPGHKSPGDYFEAGGDLRAWVRISLIQSGHYAPPRKWDVSIQSARLATSTDGDQIVDIVETFYYEDDPEVLSLHGGLRIRNRPEARTLKGSESNLCFTKAIRLVRPLDTFINGFAQEDRALAKAQIQLRPLMLVKFND